MASNHKLVCARAARQQFAGAFQQAVRDYRWAKLCAATLQGLDAYLPDGLSFRPLSYLYDDEVARFAWEGAVIKDNQDASVRKSHFRVLARTRPLQPQEIDSKLYESLSSEDGNHSIIVHDGRCTSRWSNDLYKSFAILFGWCLSSRCQQSKGLPGIADTDLS